MGNPHAHPQTTDRAVAVPPSSALQSETSNESAYLLRTFGVVDLINAHSGDRPHRVVSQPKRLAMLVYVVCQSEQTVVRDRLLSVFFPEASTERARHALSQALYVLRRDLGTSAIRLLPGDRISVDPAVIQCDALALADHIQRGDVSQALDVYVGDFLDGFHISGCSDFEDWLSRERDKWRNVVGESAARASHAAIEQDDLRSAIKFLHAWLRVAPYDEEAIRKLMDAHVDRGDRAAAVLAYRHFEEQLARDLDVEPSTETKAQAKRVADSIQHGSSAVRTTATLTTTTHKDHQPPALHKPDLPNDNNPDQVLAPIQTSEDGDATPLPSTDVLSRTESTRRRKWRGYSVAVLLAIVAAAIVALTRAPIRHQDSLPPSLAVLPFRVHGSPDIQFLREGLVDLFIAKLSVVPGVRTLSPHANVERGSDGALLTLEQQAMLVRGMGASQFLHGSVVVVGGNVQITAALRNTDTWQEHATTSSVSGTERELLDMVDQLAARLLTGTQSPPQDRFARVAAVTSDSYAAVRSYLDGEREYRRADFTGSVAERFALAREAYLRAIDEDTTFALAYHRLAALAMWTGDAEAAIRWTTQAERYGSRLPSTYRTIVRAYAAFSEHRVDDAERLFRSVLRERPDEREALYGLGDLLIHYNPLRGRLPREARQYFEVVLADAPRHPLASHIMTLDARKGNFARVDSVATLRVNQRNWHVLDALARGDRRIANDLIHDSDLFTLAAGWNVAHFLGDLRTAHDLVVAAEESPLPGPIAQEVRYVAASIELARGRLGEALGALQRRDLVSDAGAVDLSAWFLTLPFVPVGPPLRDSVVALLQRDLRTAGNYYGMSFPRQRSASKPIREYLRGLLHLRLGNVDSALSYAFTLASWSETPAVDSLARDLSRTIQARILWEQENDALAALRLLGVPNMMPPIHQLPSPFIGRNDLRFLRAELLRAVGQYEEALGWYAGFGMGEPPVDIVHLPAVHLGQAAIHEARGNLDVGVSFNRPIG